MRKLDLSNISFNKLQIFVAAAESKSFSLAGEKLNITHSAVSKNISALESDLNLILFIKDRNGASLTPAGKFLYEKTRDMFSLFNTNIEKAHEIQTGKIFSLSIGYVETSLSDKVKDTLKDFLTSYPNINLTLSQYNIVDLCNLFNKNELDVVFISNLNISLLEATDVKFSIAYKCKATLFFPDTHRFAKMEKIDFTDLKQENFISVSNDSLPGYTNLLYQICSDYNFKPNIAKVSPNCDTSYLYASMGIGIILGIDTMDTSSYSNLIKHILPNELGSIVMAWHNDSSNPLVNKFLEILT